MSMYTEIILDHYKNPRNKGSIADPDSSASDSNPFCGDSLTVQLKLKGSVIEDIKFNGIGCAISQAYMSMLTELVIGKDLSYVVGLKKEDLLSIVGIDLGPVRIKCALLGLKVLKLACYKHLGKESEDLD